MPTTDELQEQIDALTARVTANEAALLALQGRVVVKPYVLPTTPTPSLDAKHEAEQQALARQYIGQAQR